MRVGGGGVDGGWGPGGGGGVAEQNRREQGKGKKTGIETSGNLRRTWWKIAEAETEQGQKEQTKKTGVETEQEKKILWVFHLQLKVHKREKFFGSDFEFFTIL